MDVMANWFFVLTVSQEVPSDLNKGDTGAAKKFTEIGEAYEVCY